MVNANKSGGKWIVFEKIKQANETAHEKRTRDYLKKNN
jgi:hypothetical protein